GRIEPPGKRAIERVEIAERHVIKPIDRRPETFLVFPLIGRGERPESFPMETVLGGQNADPAGAGATQLNSGFDGFRPTVGESHILHAWWSYIDQPFREFTGGLKIGRLNKARLETFSHLLNGSPDILVVEPEWKRSILSQKVQVTPS